MVKKIVRLDEKEIYLDGNSFEDLKEDMEIIESDYPNASYEFRVREYDGDVEIKVIIERDETDEEETLREQKEKLAAEETQRRRELKEKEDYLMLKAKAQAKGW